MKVPGFFKRRPRPAHPDNSATPPEKQPSGFIQRLFRSRSTRATSPLPSDSPPPAAQPDAASVPAEAKPPGFLRRLYLLWKAQPVVARARDNVLPTDARLGRRAIIIRLLRQVRALWGFLIFATLVRILNHMMGIAIIGMAAWGIGQITLGAESTFQSYVHTYFVINLVLFGVAKGIFFYLEQYIGSSVALRLMANLRSQLYYHLEPLAPGGLSQARSGDIVSRAITDVDRLEVFYGQTIGATAVAVAIPLISTFAISLFNTWLALLFIPFVVGVGLVVPFIIDDLTKRHSPRLRTAAAEVSANLIDILQGLREIVSLGGAAQKRHAIRVRDERLVKVQGRIADVTGLQDALVDAIVGMCIVTLLLAGMMLVGLGQMPLAEIPAVLAIAFATFGPMSGALNVVNAVNQAIVSGNRLFTIMDQAPLVQETATTMPPGPIEPSIEFDHVTFSYPTSGNFLLSETVPLSPARSLRETNGGTLTPNGEQTAMPRVDPNGNRGQHLPVSLPDSVQPGKPPEVHHDLTFTIAPGQTVALVGPSGAGKTTVVNLLLRFWDRDSGHIRIGGVDVRDFPLEELRRMVAVVSQRTYIFNTSIKENLLIGKPDATDAEIEQAARSANIHDFIASLPNGYHTHVGEMGARLSGGQRQRLAIARALIKDAPILILDEATSNLDAISEHEIQKSIHELMRGRTTMIIAHRLSTVVGADEILVIDGGRIVERGTHAQLLRQKGVYARLFASQQDDLQYVE